MQTRTCNFAICIALIFGLRTPCMPQTVSSSSVEGKVLVGYQGWFRCPGDGSPDHEWSHWFRSGPSKTAAAAAVGQIWDVDFYPDVSELDRSSLCAVPGVHLNNGQQAYVFSSYPRATTDVHFRWMREYGIDGALLQRFVTRLPQLKAEHDAVLKNSIESAEKNGRVIAVEYDITNANPSTLFDQLRTDWLYLTDNLKVTASKAYIKENGRPIVSIWGLGFNEKGHLDDVKSALQIIDWFKSQAHTTVMGGVPAGWATLSQDSVKASEWNQVYDALDIVQPWTVGRYRDIQGVDRWKDTHLIPEIAQTKRRHQMYMPVIYPGFSWHNRHQDYKQNEIPRQSGRFFWLQANNARSAGGTMVKIAMFDELNEGTAILKVATSTRDVPNVGEWVALDADGDPLPSDWYLRLAREINPVFHGQASPKLEMPLKLPNSPQ